MDGGVEKAPRRHHAGGIVGLARIIEDHREAVEKDLLTDTGYQLSDIGTRLGWSAVRSFLFHISPGSELMRELHPEVAEWSSTAKTNAILADIFDMLATLNANILAIGSGRAAKKPKPYPRPGKKDKENERSIGSGALPPDELREWFEKKREEHARSRKRDLDGHPGPIGGAAVTN